MDGLITLADLPELAGTDPAPRSTIAVARLDDKLYDPRYGRFGITQRDVDGWRKNLADTFGGRVSIDFDHSSDRGKGTKAAAWITGLHQQAETVTADVEWTPTGAKAIRDGEYRYISPTFVENFVDEHKQSHGRALLGAALTNRPVLRKGMPTLSLSKDELEGVAVPGVKPASGKRARKHAREQLRALEREDTAALTLATVTLDVSADERKLALKEGNSLPDGSYPIRNTAQLHAAAILAASGHGDAAAAKKLIARRAKDLGVPISSLPGMGAGKKQAARDSRPQMDPKLTEIAKLLDLDDGADEAKILAAVTDLKAEEPKPEPAKPEPASEPVTLSSVTPEQFAKLLADANAGAAAARQLAEQTFQVAWNKALSEGRAAPSQEETVKALYNENPQLAIKTLDSFVKIVPTTPAGSGEGAGAEAPDGMDAERFQLHTEAKALAAKKLEADPKLDPGEAYILATQEIEERKFTLEHPGI